MLEIFFIGTGAGVPSRKRRLPSVVIRRARDLIMFDCGEGTQFRFLDLGLGINKNMYILISHLHGDHVLGLPGMIMTFSLMGREKPLYIYGPKGIKEFLTNIFDLMKFEPQYKVEIYEVREGTILETREYKIRAIRAIHTIESFSFSLEEKEKPGKFYVEKAISLGIPKGPLWKRLQMGETVKLPDGRIVRPEEVLGPPRPGFKIVYTGDTRPSEKLVEFAKNADVLIYDSTFPSSLKERAFETGHSTCDEALEVARKANVKMLVLFHISQRVTSSEDLLRDIMEYMSGFKGRVLVAEDGLKIVLKLEDYNVKFFISRDQVV